MTVPTETEQAEVTDGANGTKQVSLSKGGQLEQPLCVTTA